MHAYSDHSGEKRPTTLIRLREMPYAGLGSSLMRAKANSLINFLSADLPNFLPQRKIEMHTPSKISSSLVALVLMAALGLSACGDKTGSANTSGATGTGSSAASKNGSGGTGGLTGNAGMTGTPSTGSGTATR